MCTVLEPRQGPPGKCWCLKSTSLQTWTVTLLRHQLFPRHLIEPQLGRLWPLPEVHWFLRHHLLHLKEEERPVYGKLIFAVGWNSHWHYIHSKMGIVVTHTHTVSESHDFGVPSFNFKSEGLVDGEFDWNLSNFAFTFSSGTLFYLSSPSLYGRISSNNSNNARLFFLISDVL